MILSKNGKYLVLISHKKSRTEIVTAPHKKFKRDIFRCRHFQHFFYNYCRLLDIITWNINVLKILHVFQIKNC